MLTSNSGSASANRWDQLLDWPRTIAAHIESRSCRPLMLSSAGRISWVVAIVTGDTMLNTTEWAWAKVAVTTLKNISITHYTRGRAERQWKWWWWTCLPFPQGEWTRKRRLKKNKSRVSKETKMYQLGCLVEITATTWPLQNKLSLCCLCQVYRESERARKSGEWYTSARQMHVSSRTI